MRVFLSCSYVSRRSVMILGGLFGRLLLLDSPRVSGFYQFFAMRLLPMGLRGFLSLFGCLIVGLDDLFLRF